MSRDQPMEQPGPRSKPPRFFKPFTDLRFTRGEAGGAVGDLGTFLPLLAGMVSSSGLHLGHALLFAGVAAIVAGLNFGIPMPVQPMKAIAIVVIAEGMNVPELLAAGMATGAVVLVLALTGLIGRINRSIPRSLIRAIQLALGLKLLYKGFEMSIQGQPWIGGDSIALAAVSVALVLLLPSSRRIPGALAIFALGLVVLLVSQPQLVASLRLGLEPPTFHSISRSEWVAGLWHGALPQIPLTLLNSVLAVSLLSADLFGERRAAGPKKVALSVGLMNLLLCPFGAMPMCHGAGGLAAQHRFGGRTGGCTVLLGLSYIVLALLFGSSLFVLFAAYPRSILGVLLGFAGVSLVLVCRDQRAPQDIAVLVTTAGIALMTNVGIGFLAGLALVVMIWAARQISGSRLLGFGRGRSTDAKE